MTQDNSHGILSYRFFCRKKKSYNHYFQLFFSHVIKKYYSILFICVVPTLTSRVRKDNFMLSYTFYDRGKIGCLKIKRQIPRRLNNKTIQIQLFQHVECFVPVVAYWMKTGLRMSLFYVFLPRGQLIRKVYLKLIRSVQCHTKDICIHCRNILGKIEFYSISRSIV